MGSLYQHVRSAAGSVSLPKEGNIPTYAVLKDGVFTIKGFDGTVVKELAL